MNTAPPQLQRPLAYLRTLVGLVDRWLAPLFDAGIRLYVASVFFRAGWLKLANWSSTLALFENEYHVPLLTTAAAAVLATAGELLLSVMLALGLGGRFGAAGLSIINLVAVIAYSDISEVGRQDHLLWGALLLVILLHGSGRMSIDAWLSRRWFG